MQCANVTGTVQSCGRRGHRGKQLTAAAVDANAAARYVAVAWQMPGRVRFEVSPSHQVPHLATGRPRGPKRTVVLMADESRQTVIPSLAGIVRPLRPVDCGVVDVRR